LLTVLAAAGVLLTGGLAWAVITLTLIDTIETDLWEIWAPGPSGVAYNADNDTMFVVDTDRNNYSEFDQDGIDLWEISLAGAVLRTGELPIAEPTGIDYDPVGNRLFVTTDSPNQVMVIDIGADGIFGTGDDGESTAILTSAWGSGDTEDPAYDPATGDLFFLSGDEQELYRIDPDIGSLIEGPIDISGLGPSNFEGLALDPASGNLLAGSAVTDEIFLINK
jgi:DNA-binding beta-propeller fold protein YncE